MSTIFINPESIKDGSITKEKLSDDVLTSIWGVHFAGIYPVLPEIVSVIFNNEGEAIGANITWSDYNGTASVGDIIIIASSDSGDSDIQSEHNKEYILANQSNVIRWIELGDVTAEGQRISALETRVGTIEDDYLKGADKTDLEGKITTAQNAANAAQGDVSALEARVAELERIIEEITIVENAE